MRKEEQRRYFPCSRQSKIQCRNIGENCMASLTASQSSEASSAYFTNINAQQLEMNDSNVTKDEMTLKILNIKKFLSLYHSVKVTARVVRMFLCDINLT